MAKLQKNTFSSENVTIVIPTYNRPNLALNTAKLIRKLHPEVEIIIVDQLNKSPINIKEYTTFKIRYFNLDFANTSSAKNKGIGEAHGNIIFFFDDDIEITKTTISHHLATYNSDDIVGVAGRVINDGETIPINTDVETGKTNFLATKFIFQFWSTKKQRVDFPYGCNMSFRKDVLLKEGGFDETFSKIFEEIDLGVRISKKYGAIAFIPNAIVYHHKAKVGGTRTEPKEKMKMLYTHYAYYIAKHVPFPFSLVSILLRTKTILKEAPFTLQTFYHSYLICLFKKHVP